jgi:hypothetical protein
MRNVLWSLVFVFLAGRICSAQTVLYFPQFVDGAQNVNGDTGWISAMAISNPAAPGTPVASGTITLTQDNGTPMNMTLLDENGAPAGNTFQLAGGQTKFFLSAQSNANGLIPFSSGYATVTSNLPVSGGLVFIEANSVGTFAAAGVPTAAALTSQATVVVVTHRNNPNNQDNTGVAVVNPGNTTANITFQLLDKSGVSLAPQVTRALAPANHTAFFVSDLFPSAPANIYGTMRITSDKPVAATALFFQGPAFATLPILTLQ